MRSQYTSIARLLMQPRLTAVRHRLVERLEAGESFRPVGHARFQILVEPPVAFAPGLGLPLAELLREVFTHERMGVHGGVSLRWIEPSPRGAGA